MNDIERYAKERSERDEAFREAWRNSEPEYEIMRLIVEGRQECGLSQQEVAERCGMKQSNVSRLETGGGNPTVSTLQKLARCFGKQLEIRFVDPVGPTEALPS